MKKDLIEKFKNGEIAVNVETPQEWNEFMQWLEENTDLRWDTGHKPTEKNYWERYVDQTTVSIFGGNLVYADVNWKKGCGSVIIKYKDLKEKKKMKTSEFIKRVEELGYTFEDGVGFEIYYNSRIVARVFKMHESVVDTSFDAFRHLDNAHKAELLDLMVEYAKTPLEEREEEKKYYIRPKGMNWSDATTLEYEHDTQEWSEGYIDDMSRNTQVEFTLKELENLGIDVEHYGLREVE